MKKKNIFTKIKETASKQRNVTVTSQKGVNINGVIPNVKLAPISEPVFDTRYLKSLSFMTCSQR